MNQSKIYQLDFFKSEEESEIDSLRDRIDSVKESNDKVRKKLFSENGKLTKRILDLEEKMNIIEKNLCKGNV